MRVKRAIYLDYAAATPVADEVLAAMRPYFAEQFYNPAATYERAQQARTAIEEAKKTIGTILGVKSSEIILTSGGTEANNLAINGLISQFPGEKVLISAVEHESVLQPAYQWHCAEIPVDKRGFIDVKQVLKMIEDDVVLVSVMLANNEVGAVQPVKELAQELVKIRRDRLARKVKLPLLLHSDACQAPLLLDIHPHRLGVDMMTLNGGKIYGPRQSGLLYVRAGVVLEPMLRGGGQQRGLRSGTESPAAAVGLAKALELAQQNRGPESQRLGELQQYFFTSLQQKLPTAIINGPSKRRLPNNLHITLPGSDNERLINQLDEAGIMAAAGSACSAASGKPSHVLRAMTITDDMARASLRLTMGRSTTKNDLNHVVETLARLTA